MTKNLVSNFVVFFSEIRLFFLILLNKDRGKVFNEIVVKFGAIKVKSSGTKNIISRLATLIKIKEDLKINTYRNEILLISDVILDGLRSIFDITRSILII